MEYFLFAAEAMLPTACILLCGYCMKKKGIITDTFLEQGDKLCFSFLFPVLVFWNIYHGGGNDLIQGQCIKVIFTAYAIIFLSAFGGMLFIPKIIKDSRQIPVVIQSLYRGNFMLYGLPFSGILGGEECLVVATALTAATVPLWNMIAIFQFSYYTGKDRENWMEVFLRICKNPIIWGVMTGIIFQKMGVVLPSILEKTVVDLAEIASPLAFLLLGGRFYFSSFGKNGKLMGAILLYKLWLMPMIILPVAHFVLRMSRVELIPLFIFVSAPAAITTYQLAGQYDADVKLAGDIVVYSLFISVITMFFLITLQKYLNWI